MVCKPLQGKTIVITRPREKANPLALKLSRAGARVILAPTIRIDPPASYSGLDASLRGLKSYDALVFTSANAVESFFKRAKRLRLKSLPRPKRLFAIGPKTAEALRHYGWQKARMPENHRGEDLARSLGDVSGSRILIPQARVAREALSRMLSRRGAQVSLVESYRTIPDKSGLKFLKKTPPERIDAVTFTSESTVHQFVSQWGAARSRKLFIKAAAASIGPITSSALRKHGIRPAVEAKKYTAAGLYAALIEHFQR